MGVLLPEVAFFLPDLDPVPICAIIVARTNRRPHRNSHTAEGHSIQHSWPALSPKDSSADGRLSVLIGKDASMPKLPISRYLGARVAYGPSISSDGRRLAFVTNITGVPQVW